jgi:hypothetical protein
MHALFIMYVSAPFIRQSYYLKICDASAREWCSFHFAKNSHRNLAILATSPKNCVYYFTSRLVMHPVEKMKRHLKTNSSRNVTVAINLLLMMSQWYFGNQVGIVECISVGRTQGRAFLFVCSSRSSRIMLKRKTFLKDNDDFGFHPKFDGQLFYGHEADHKGYIKTSLSQIKRKILSSVDETLLKDRYRYLKVRSRAILNDIPIISRTVAISTNISVMVWEVE